jgi:hypothetical protein
MFWCRTHGLPDCIFSYQKIPVWINYGVSSKRRYWYILWRFGQFSGHLIYFMALWYILWSFGILHHEQSGNPATRQSMAMGQGCQILLGTWYQNRKWCTKWTQIVPYGHKKSQMVIKYFNIIQSKALQNLPKLAFLAWKQTIWQPCHGHGGGEFWVHNIWPDEDEYLMAAICAQLVRLKNGKFPSTKKSSIAWHGWQRGIPTLWQDWAKFRRLGAFSDKDRQMILAQFLGPMSWF